MRLAVYEDDDALVDGRVELDDAHRLFDTIFVGERFGDADVVVIGVEEELLEFDRDVPAVLTSLSRDVVAKTGCGFGGLGRDGWLLLAFPLIGYADHVHLSVVHAGHDDLFLVVCSKISRSFERIKQMDS